jgi:UDP-N-acetylmuramoyl-tripeptide--D-alanyl-D-alanine ligase
MKGLLTRYKLSYLRTLVYMLQASEYNVRDYLGWYRRTRHFDQVERRKYLVYTLKARSLLLILAVSGIVGILGGVAGTALAAVQGEWGIVILSILMILLTPFIQPYLVLIPLVLGQWLIQRPREKFIIDTASKRLERMPALKIAVVGSYGKTTFKENLRQTLTDAKKVAATPGNKNTPLGISTFVDQLEGDEEVLIFEMGEYYPGDIKKLCQLVKPDIGVISGINEAHLEKFKSLKRTVATIYEIADFVAGDKLYVNAENALAKQHARSGNVLYDREGTGGWQVKQAKSTLFGTTFVAEKEGQKIQVKSGLLGLHQVGPLVACLDIASQLGVPNEQIEFSLSRTTPFEHRMQPITTSEGITTIDDTYNGNPDGAKAGIDFLAGLDAKRKIYVTPGFVEMGTRTKQVHSALGKWLAPVVDMVVLVENSVTPYIAEGLQEHGYKGEIKWFKDAESCLAALPSLSVAGDVLLMQNDWPDNYA